MEKLFLYNTLTRKKEEFKPLKDKVVTFYQCGPTVYWTQHIGNMRAMVLADLIVRSLRYLGYEVTFVRNYTDVGHLTSDQDLGEDKIEKGAKREGKTPEEIAAKYTKLFEQDVKDLNVLEPWKKPVATKHIKEMIKMVQTLLDSGYAYATDLAVYFDVSKAKNYTQLSGQDLEKNISDAGKGEVSDPAKKHPADFALWFFAAGVHKNVLQTWPSPFNSVLAKNGEGFPGWHIECSAMSQKYLGDTLDIHMGGIEHIPVHHTNEIAQSESATGKKFVDYWLHNEHLTVDGGKMAKSAGTSYSLADIKKKGYDPIVLRYLFLQAHYRSKQNFTWEALKASQTALNKLYAFIQNQPDKDPDIPLGARNRIYKRNLSLINNYKKEFLIYISDDFIIPAAVALVWEIVKDEFLPYFEKKNLILDFDRVLGLGLDKIEDTPEEIMEIAKKSEEARKNKDYKTSDELRALSASKGYDISNTTAVDGGFIIKKRR